MSYLTDMKTFDGRDNRREVMLLLDRLGHGLPEREGALRRARFLQKLMGHSQTGFAARPLHVDSCSTKEAYFALLYICNALGVSIDHAARLLEAEVLR